MSDSINREDVIRMAKESGFKACVGTTDKEGNYHPFVNALGKDIPIEWLERFAALAALRAQPADPFKKLSDAQVLWLAQSHGIDVYACNTLAFYNDLISTTQAKPDHSEPFATMSITDDTGVIFSGLPSEAVFKPGEKFHLSRVNSLEGKTK